MMFQTDTELLEKVLQELESIASQLDKDNFNPIAVPVHSLAEEIYQHLESKSIQSDNYVMPSWLW